MEIRDFLERIKMETGALLLYFLLTYSVLVPASVAKQPVRTDNVSVEI